MTTTDLGQTVRTVTVRAAAALARGAVTGWRYLATVYALARLGLLWRAFCANTGLAVQRTHTDAYTGRMRTQIYAVPRLDHVRVGPHGWTTRVRLRPGQALDDYTAAAEPLRHVARAQAVKAVQLPAEPGFVEVRVLRRDPLTRVVVRPRAVSPGQLLVGAIDSGDPLLIDCDRHPHHQVIGATGSGKSTFLHALQAAIAPTDAALVFWDLKFGLEAEAWRARYTEIATTQRAVLAAAERVLWLAEQRTGLLKQLGVRNLAEAAELGVHFRRVFVLVDEVAELAHDHDADKTADRVLRELLRIVQLVRAMGVHVILCGQCFGSDLGKLVTSIRAQVSGRICLQVNDVQTAEMVLAGLPTEVQKLALSLNRPGMGIVQDGQDWHYGRCAYLTPVEVRALAAAHAAKRMTWDALAADDQAVVATYTAVRWQERAR